MKHFSLRFVGAAGIVLVLLTGCSGQAGLKVLDRAATVEDALPAIVPLPDQVNRDSARLLASKDGVQYFAAQSDDARTTCMALVPPGDASDSHVGCGDTKSAGEIVNMSSSEGAFSTILLGDDSDTGKIESGWIKIADNILIAER